MCGLVCAHNVHTGGFQLPICAFTEFNLPVVTPYKTTSHTVFVARAVQRKLQGLGHAAHGDPGEKCSDMYVYYCRTYSKAVSGGGEGKGGVLKRAVAEGGVSRLQGMPGIPCSDMPVI